MYKRQTGCKLETQQCVHANGQEGAFDAESMIVIDVSVVLSVNPTGRHGNLIGMIPVR